MIDRVAALDGLEHLRRSPLGPPGISTNLKKLRLIQSTFRGWLLPCLLLPLATILAPRRRLSWLTVRMEEFGVFLSDKGSGIRIKAPVMDVWPAFEVFAFGEYDFSVFHWPSIRTAVDCGAHVGSFSLWLSHQTACQIVAVEPNPIAHRFLQHNVAGLGRRISMSTVAVGGRNEQRTLYDSGFPGISSFSSTSGQRGFQVDVITLEELFDRSGLAEVDLLKMDIEGAEAQVFETVSTATLRRIRAAVIECHPEAGTDITLIKAKLAEAGMQVASEPRMVVAWRN